MEHPDIRYSPPEHIFYPNVEHVTLSIPQLTTLALVAVQPPYVPPVRFSLTKTKRKLHLPAPAAGRGGGTFGGEYMGSPTSCRGGSPKT